MFTIFIGSLAESGKMTVAINNNGIFHSHCRSHSWKSIRVVNKLRLRRKSLLVIVFTLTAANNNEG